MSIGYNSRRLSLRIRLQACDEARDQDRDQDSDDELDQSGDELMFQDSDEIGDEVLYQSGDEIGDGIVDDPFLESDESGGESWDEVSEDEVSSEVGEEPELDVAPLNYLDTTTWPAALEGFYANLFAQTIQMTKGWEENGHGIYRPPAHMRSGHSHFPLEVPASLGRPDRQPYIPDSDNRFIVDKNDDDDDDLDVNVKFPTGMSWAIWGIPDEFTCTLEEAYYFHTKWCLLDPEASQDFVSESEIMQAELCRLMDHPMSNATDLRALIHRLLKASFREIELDIIGEVKRGKIVHWVTSPKVSSGYLPLMVFFEPAVNTGSRYYQLLRTTLEDEEDAVVKQIGGEMLTFNQVTQRRHPVASSDSIGC